MKYLNYKEETLKSLYNFSKTTDLPLYPLEVFLEISNVCDLKCAMCGTFSALDQWRFFHLKDTDRGFFDATKQSSLETVLQHAVLVHCFGYGEPTIHPNFKEIISYISEYEVLIDFFTNGMHLTEELCEFLVQKKVFRIYISFSGSTKEDYENIYIGGHYETVLNGIKLLNNTKKKYKSKYPQIEINSLAFQHHVDKIVNFVGLMATCGANVISLKPLEIHQNIPYLNQYVALMRPWVEGKLLKKAKFKAFFKRIRFDASHFINTKSVNTEEEFLLKKEALLHNAKNIPITDFKILAKKLTIFKPDKENNILLNFDVDNIENLLDFDYPEKLEQPCFEPFKTLYVSRNGQTKPCCFGQNIVGLGNINQTSAQEIWQTGGFSLIRKNITVGKYPMIICKQCLKIQSNFHYHAIREISEAYNLWLKRIYKMNLSNLIDKNICNLKDNHSMIYKSNTSPIVVKKIVNICLNQESLTNIVKFNIEHPKIGINIINNSLDIQGWILPMIPQVLVVNLYNEHKLLQSVPVDICRPDVSEHFKHISHANNNTGFLIKYEIPFKSKKDIHNLTIQVRLENGENYDLGCIQLKIFLVGSPPKNIENLIIWTKIKKIFSSKKA
jgi:MoaA/NifB/PqqE/SkfB family radical SAM enzyme